MRAEVAIVPDQVLPVAALPDGLLAAGTLGRVASRQGMAARVSAREGLLDLAPACWIVAIAVGQGPYRMQVVGQNDLRLNRERPFLSDAPDGGIQQPDRRLLGEDREEIAGTRHRDATIAHRPFSVLCVTMCWVSLRSTQPTPDIPAPPSVGSRRSRRPDMLRGGFVGPRYARPDLRLCGLLGRRLHDIAARQLGDAEQV